MEAQEEVAQAGEVVVPEEEEALAEGPGVERVEADTPERSHSLL